MGDQERNLRFPVCPVCGQECETVYLDHKTRDILGCDVCVDVKDAWSRYECFPGEE